MPTSDSPQPTKVFLSYSHDSELHSQRLLALALRVFVESFYSQGSDERRNASSELFFEQALAFFGHQGEPIKQADEQGRALARLLIEQRGLLVLDGLEPLQHPPLHGIRDRSAAVRGRSRSSSKLR
jgi:hypothetical protein